MDTRGRAAEYVAQLDSTRNLQGVEHTTLTQLKILELAPGQRVLEVASGTGDFARQLAAAVAPTGTVTGIELSPAMVATATERMAESGLPLTFQVGDAHHLEFPDHTFDRVFGSAIFVHLNDPLGALQEIVRVTRQGGRIVVNETDKGTHTFFGVDIHVSRAVVDALARHQRNGWIAHQTLQLFREAGLTDITVEPTTFWSSSLQSVMARVRYRESIDWAVQDGAVGEERASAWWHSLEAADRDGTFFWAGTSFLFAGQRP
jgi:ubiquinone/menaquinone biosynthesis C-methylase UbiE